MNCHMHAMVAHRLLILEWLLLALSLTDAQLEITRAKEQRLYHTVGSPQSIVHWEPYPSSRLFREKMAETIMIGRGEHGSLIQCGVDAGGPHNDLTLTRPVIE